MTYEVVRAAYEKAYGDEPFVTLLPEASWPQTASVLGSNSVHLQVALDESAAHQLHPGAFSISKVVCGQRARDRRGAGHAGQKCAPVATIPVLASDRNHLKVAS